MAVINADNAVELTVGAYYGVPTTEVISVFGAAVVGSDEAQSFLQRGALLYSWPIIKEIEKFTFSGDAAPELRAIQPVTDTTPGNCGGSSTLTLNVDDTSGNFTGTMQYDSYCEDGETISGTVNVSGNVDLMTLEIAHMEMSFNQLTVTSTSGSVTLSGTMSGNFAPPSLTLTLNYLIRDNGSGKVYKVVNYGLTLVEGTDWVEMTFSSGRYYHPDYGYVEVATVEPFMQYVGDFGPSSGELIITGASLTKASLMALTANAFEVTADTDGDGTFDEFSSGILNWTTENTAPAVNAGPDQNVSTGALVILDGSGSTDADGDLLTYSWSFSSTPGGSSATLSDPSIANPSFTTDVDGTYVISLVVNDGTVDSAADTVTITATLAPGVGNTFPIANTTSGEMSLTAAFDGTNYLVAIGTEEQSGGPMSSNAQFIDLNGSLVAPLISSGCDGMPLVGFGGTNHLHVGGDCDTWNQEVWGRFVSPSGTVGTNFLIAGTDAENNGVAFGGGNYLFVYTRLVNEATGESKVHGMLVDPAGNVGNEITISTGYGVGGVLNVAFDFDGSRFLVVWVDATNNYEVKGRFVGTTGTLGTEFTINASPEFSHNPLTVAFDGTNYLVVWSDKAGGITQDLYAQLVNTSGNLVGDVITISIATGEQGLPSIAFDGTNYLVTWTDSRNDANGNSVCDAGEGTCTDIYGQYVNTAGVLVGTEFVINDDPGDQLGVVAGFSGWKYLVLINDGVVLSEPLMWGDVYGVFVTP